MSIWQAIVLGLVQGLTEFLPVSSTAHLRVVPALVGWNDPGASFTAVTQLGTLLATLVYFRTDITRLLLGTWDGVRSGDPMGHPGSRLAVGILLGTLPIGLLGILFKKAIRSHLRSLQVIALALIALGLVLWWVERRRAAVAARSEATFGDALWVGLAQAVALIPGASRSGTTLTAGMLAGLDRAAAARFSFLLGIPAVAAAGVFELKDVVTDPQAAALWAPTLIATVVAFVSGMATIDLLLRFLQRNGTGVFVAWRLGLGAVLLVLLTQGILQPMTGIAAPRAERSYEVVGK